MLLMVVSLLIFGIPMVMLNINRTSYLDEEFIASVSPFWLVNIMINQYLLSLGEF